MEIVVIDDKKYEVMENVKDALNIEDLEGKITEYYDGFDYILGDYAYGKVRLKGFNDKDNKYFKAINDISKVKEYIENYIHKRSTGSATSSNLDEIRTLKELLDIGAITDEEFEAKKAQLLNL